VDRLEKEVIPALRAGFIVLTDRYIYSLMARAIVRGMDATWIRGIYSAALVPDAVFYLRVDVEHLIPRVIFSRGFDYWESGMDLFPGQDMYESFRSYQSALLEEFDKLSVEFRFDTVDASADAKIVFAQLQAKVQRLLNADSRSEFLSGKYELTAAAFARRLEERSDAVARESAARATDWARQPVAANFVPANGRNLADHK
jgi:thymidylate kinase